MLTRPRFHPHLRVEVVTGEGVFLLSSSQQTLLRGRLYELVAPHLDGRTADEVCDVLDGSLSPAEVYYALGLMERKGYLCDDEPLLPAEQAALWSLQGVSPAVAAQRLGQRPISVRAFGIDPAPFCDLLQSMNVQLAEAGAADVILTDSYLRPELKDCNAASLEAGRPWLLVRPTGRQVWVGPLFRPSATACFQCLNHRLRANSPVANYLEQRSGRSAGDERASVPATVQIGFGMAANAIATWIVRDALPDLEGKLQTFDVVSWKLQSHAVARLPFCSACGNANGTAAFRIPAIESRRKSFTSDGGHRVATPEETLARYEHHVSPITGAVPLLERADSSIGDGVMHVYLAGKNSARSHRNLANLRSDMRHMCAGKGVTEAQARASALCEGLERYSGVYRGDELRRAGTMAEFHGAAIDPRDCLLFSERQYRERDSRNATGCRFSFIPAPFKPEASIDWTPVWSLTKNAMRYVPSALAYYDFPLPDDHFFCMACSNGCASGNTFEEAVVQGFFELVERDGVALWWYNRIRRPAVDLDSFGEPYLGRLQKFLHRHGRDYWVIDLSTDLDIPVFASISRRTEGAQQQIVLGFGAHFDAKIALLRAVTEMNQMLTSPLLKGEEVKSKNTDTDPETAQWLMTATTDNQPYLLPVDGVARTAASYPYEWNDDLLADIRACQARVEAAGFEMLVLDQTRPEIGMPVAKVIVPGLRHFWARFAPGRLYDIPVKMGWLSRPLAEEGLNPIPMFL